MWERRKESEIMARPHCRRRIAATPGCLAFKPAGVARSGLAEIVLGMDELEALRLADVEGLYQEDAAERMKVSRQTFGRIVAAARKKVAKALVEGTSLRIEGGTIEMAETRRMQCRRCASSWEEPRDAGGPGACPSCGGQGGRGGHGGGGGGGGRGGHAGRGGGARKQGGGKGGQGGQGGGQGGRAGRGGGGGAQQGGGGRRRGGDR
jgi:predicted DNA-binding protein (UPF0251 family)